MIRRSASSHSQEKRIPIAQLDLGQRSDRLDADFLQDVVDLDLAPQLRLPTGAR